jgi:TonB family protein
MRGQNRVLDQKQIFVSNAPVPRRAILLLTVAGYVGLLVWITVSGPAPKLIKVPQQYAVQRISPAGHLQFRANSRAPSQPHARLFTAHRFTLPKRLPESEGAGTDAATEVIREHARQATAAIVTDLKQRRIYGFSPGNYEIPIWLSGEYPFISPTEVPPRFEQLVTVEITIDVDGRVADARIVSGLVDAPIQRKLLAAIREFKYNPAKRGGTPIPSQLDLVIHVPS